MGKSLESPKQNSTPRLAHHVSSGMSKNESLGPWLTDSWVSGLLQSVRRSNLGDIDLERERACGDSWQKSPTLQTPQTSESGERAAKFIPEKTSEVVGCGGLG